MLNFLMILILLSTLHSATAKKKTRSLYFLSVKYDKNEKYLNNFEISIKADNTSITILMELLEDVDKVFCSTNVLIWIKTLNEYKQVITYEVNMCQQLQRTKLLKTNIIGIWIHNVLKFGNITKSCPIQKNLYVISNLKPEKESIPSFIPAGRCRIVSSIYIIQNGAKLILGNTQLDMELK